MLWVLVAAIVRSRRTKAVGRMPRTSLAPADLVERLAVVLQGEDPVKAAPYRRVELVIDLETNPKRIVVIEVDVAVVCCDDAFHNRMGDAESARNLGMR